MPQTLTDKITVDWKSLIYRGVESDELDYKAAMNWNRLPRPGRAKLVRHCLAMANTKGGYVIVGVGEDASGHPSVYTGLNREEAHSFDPSIVGPFINRHVEPPIDFTIERPLVDGKRYAVFVIRPFSSLPHVCANGVEGELQQGVFYIRTTDASSRPAVRAMELHQLIQRALRNQRELLGRMLRGILYENREQTEKPNLRFSDDAATARNYFLRRHPLPADADMIRLEIVVALPEYDPERFTFAELRRAAEAARQPRTEEEWLAPGELEKAYCTNTALRIFPENTTKFCQIGKSGLLFYTRLCPTPDRRLPCEFLLKFSAEAVDFISRLYSELGFVEQMLEMRVTLANTDRLVLTATSPEPRRTRQGRPIRTALLQDSEPCRIAEVKTTLRRTAADLASGCEAHAARLMREIGERFNLDERVYRQLPKLMRTYLDKR